ncbi:PREDICTED: caspase-3-like [Priapulus caudatus]|uniref:Caspase-3-like n=1 Tax=Priapulus caudatus TaxID=37621 RepID=A0ABM1EX91_PRICU|nr:PREDICTED: caspase-3-like [Priapulus caudatus]
MADVSEQPEAEAPDATATDEDADGDATDAFGVPGSVWAAGGASARTEIPLDDAYRMDHPRRGRAIIINNKLFHPRTQMSERSGTDTDASSLYVQLSKLGFDVSRYDNLRAKEMVRVMEAAAREDHTDADCFAAAILSHGEEGVVFGADGEVGIDALTAPFKGPRCKSLVGKPKIFIIQACRGTELDHGVDASDAESGGRDEDEADAVAVQRIPVEADFLMFDPFLPAGYYSWRNSARGSWFVQCLCRALERFAGKMEFCRLLTRVNKMVSYEHESNASSASMNRKKQVPCISSMLTRDLYLPPRQ